MARVNYATITSQQGLVMGGPLDFVAGLQGLYPRVGGIIPADPSYTWRDLRTTDYRARIKGDFKQMIREELQSEVDEWLKDAL